MSTSCWRVVPGRAALLARGAAPGHRRVPHAGALAAAVPAPHPGHHGQGRLLRGLAALIGLLLAGAGIAGSQLTGDELWDGLASIAIGLLLLVVATVLARANVSLLVGRAVPRRMHNQIADDLAGFRWSTAVPTLLTMQLGPAPSWSRRRSTSPTR